MKIETKLLGRGLTVSTVGPLKSTTTGEMEYETIVFHRRTGGRAWERKAYKTKADATKGHDAVVAYWKNRPRSEIRSRVEVYTRRPRMV